VARPHQLESGRYLSRLDRLGTAFPALQTFITCLSQPGLDECSERFQSVKLREALTDSMPALVQAGIAHRLQSSTQLTGSTLITALLADIETILG